MIQNNLGPLDNLIRELSKLPGVGPKSASRLAFFLLKHPTDEALALAQAIVELKRDVKHCSKCFNITMEDPCAICTDAKRDQTVVCVVEQPQELIAIENTGEYRGLYHVLMGALSPISGLGPEDLTVNELAARVKNSKIEEVIIATNPTNDGEATAVFIMEELKDCEVTLSRIAQGLPVGSNLEHVDNVTMIRSIQTRRKL